ncbi:hypothetical protein [Nocardia carnea]|uniref:hypothetical protein n=1 Tax=Nocardia carnea TaxID=37328 RepID=UPI00245507E1|nr:hypothetical protein [Nocardia carnea]
MAVAGVLPVVSGPPAGPTEAILTEVNRCGIPASYAGAPGVPRQRAECERPATPRPITIGRRSGAQAIVVVIDRSLLEFLVGDSGYGPPNRRLPLLRSARVRLCENRLCERVGATALTIDARRLLIVCDAGQASRAERTRAIRWVRRVAHRIGYECSIEGLPTLGTAYLVVVSDIEAGTVARSVVDWYRAGGAR